MKSYIRLNRNFVAELSAVLRTGQWAKTNAQHIHWRTTLALEQIYKTYGVRWQAMKLLEIGCGQKLAYTLSFSQRNSVTAIDTEPPFHRPYLRSFLDLLRHGGFYRTLKTSANALLGTRRLLRQALSELAGFKGNYDAKLLRMNALDLTFPADHFDGVFSFSVFEHISEPARALQEVKRVLKPGGVFYLDLHLYTSSNGDHDFRSADAGSSLPLWKHIRPSCEAQRRETCYLNKIRLAQWQQMIRLVFDEVQFLAIDGEADRARRQLTAELRRELSCYSEEELLTTTVIAVARKT
jgi:SAM-dependent methyltransferase